MFALQPKPTFVKEVVLTVPGGGEGKFKGVFKHKGKTELQEFFASISDPEKPRPDIETVLDILEGWEGVDQKFSKENVEILLENYVGAHIAILNAYSTGYFEAKEKN